MTKKLLLLSLLLLGLSPCSNHTKQTTDNSISDNSTNQKKVIALFTMTK